MGQILVRNIDDTVVERLKSRAKSNRRSLEAEVRLILEQNVRLDPVAFWEAADRLSRELEASGKQSSDSTDIVREARDEQ